MLCDSIAGGGQLPEGQHTSAEVQCAGPQLSSEVQRPHLVRDILAILVV